MASSSTLAAERRPQYVERFTVTERLLHWVHASAFTQCSVRSVREKRRTYPAFTT